MKKKKKKTQSRQVRVQAKKTDRESQLLEAYLEVARREGIENVTLQKIADHAEVAYSTVHYYFGSSSLITRALDYVSAASESFIAEHLSPAIAAPQCHALSVYIDTRFEWVQRFPAYASMLSYLYYQATRDEDAEKRSKALSIYTQEKIHTLLLREVDKGHIQPLENIGELSMKIATILKGALITEMSTSGKDDTLKKMSHTLVNEVIALHVKSQ